MVEKLQISESALKIQNETVVVLQSAIRSLQDEVLKKGQEINAFQSLRSAQRGKIMQLSSQLSERMSEHKELATQKEKTEALVKSLRIEVHGLKTKNQMQTRKIAELTQQISELEVLHQTLSKRLEGVDRVFHEISRLTAENTYLWSMHATAYKAFEDGLREAVRGLAGNELYIAPGPEAVRAQLVREIEYKASQKARISELEGENGVLLEENHRLSKQLEEALRQISAQNAAHSSNGEEAIH